MESKIKRAQGGAGAMQLVAKGDVEIGLTFLSEMDVPGIDVGRPPAAGDFDADYLGRVRILPCQGLSGSSGPLELLSSPQAAAVYKAHGMQPGSVSY